MDATSKYSPSQPRDTKGRFSGGGGVGGTPLVGASGATLAMDDTHWSTEDTILGEMVFEGVDGESIDDGSLKSLVSSNVNLAAIRSSDDIEDVKLLNVDRGSDWVRVEVDITPTERAGQRWLNRTAGEEEWNLYHGQERKNMPTKTIDGEQYHSGDFLVVEDQESPSTWHLQVKRNGKPDHNLMGAAWAALHGGYRGNKYSGPNKQEAIGKLRGLYESEEMPIPSEKEIDGTAFVVYKGVDGVARWLSVSSTSFQDHDKQTVSQKALEDDNDRSNSDGYYGPLRWQHVGDPDFIAQKAGPGLDIGDCDWSTMWGKLLVESGTFRSKEIADAVSNGGPYEVSIAFFHQASQPDEDGVFTKIKRFERSLLPAGRASNRFTSFINLGGVSMANKQKALEDLRDLLGDDLAKEVSAQLEAKEKEAENSGVSFKERIANIFTALKGGDAKEENAVAAKPKTVGEMTVDELRSALKPAANDDDDKEDSAAESKEIAALKEANDSAVKRISALEDGLRTLLKELEDLTGKPGYRPTEDNATVKAQGPQTGIDNEIASWLNGGA